MSCIKQGNIRCSDCCKVLHISGTDWNRLERKKVTSSFDYTSLLKRISKRRAKKKNPYIFKSGEKDFLSKAAFFTCNNYTNEVCSDYVNRPPMCKDYGKKGRTDNEYSPTCSEDLNIIARSNY